jgi:hypothetical protein
MILYTKNLKNLLFASTFAIFLMAAAFGAHAAITPTLSLSNLGNGQIQATVTGDPSAAVSLYYYTQNQTQYQYPSSASGQNVGTIGYTSNNEYLSVTLSAGQYNIPSGAYVYAMVDGAISQTVQWPNYTNSTTYSISFSQNNITIVQGQSMTVTLYGGSGSYYISQNSSLVNANINSNTLNISGVTAGSGSIIVCSNNSSCGTLSVTVTSSSYGYSYPTTYQTSYPTSYSTPYSSTYPTSYNTYPAYSAYPTYPLISLSQDSVSLNAGQQESLNIYGSGQGYYVYSNSNSYAVTASVNGSTLSINATEPGTSSIMVCESVGASCATLYVTVNAMPTFIYSYTPTYTYSTPVYYSQPQPIYYSQPIVQRIAQPVYNFYRPVTQFSSYAYPRNW